MEWVDFEFRRDSFDFRTDPDEKARTLPIYRDMRRSLEGQRETCPLYGVFHGARNRPVDNHLNGWKEVCECAGQPGLLFHDLRRSAVRNIKRAGVQDKLAMESPAPHPKHL